MATISSPNDDFLLLDTNVIGWFFNGKAPIQFDDWIEKLKDKGILRPYRNQRIVLTPFGFLEIVGLSEHPTSNELPDVLNFALKTKKDRRQIFRALHQSALNFIVNHPDLNEANLHDLVTRRSQRVPSSSRSLFNQIIASRINHPDFCKLIYDHLAWDAVFKLEIPAKQKNERRYFETSVLFSIIEATQLNRNISFGRGVKSIWDSLYARMIKESKAGEFSLTVAEINEFNAAMSIKRHSDLLDLEILHLAIFGWHDGSNHVPIKVFTQDPPEKTRNRIRLYKTMMNTFIQKTFDYIQKQAPELSSTQPPRLSPGRLIHIDKNFEILNQIRVGTLTDIS